MIAGLAGLDGLVGYPGGRVLGSQSSYADPNASLHALLAVLAALWRRAQTGAGAWIDVSQWEAAVSVMGEQLIECAMGRAPAAGPSGTAHPAKAPYGHYPATGDDRWIAIAVATDAQWQALGEALGRPPWMADAAYATVGDRIARRDLLDRRLADETRRFEAAALAEVLSAVGVPAAPLLRAEELAASPQVVRRALFERVDHPVLGALPVYRLPWRVDGAPLSVTRRAPLLGEHRDYVMEGVLGYSPARVAELAAAGLFA
jgi:crotonobetainyl-CoA:carnitine CoA-transferase CaiB-like acyl-CoA transferase